MAKRNIQRKFTDIISEKTLREKDKKTKKRKKKF